MTTQVIAVLGSQWGDEGKGKIVDVLCKDVDIVARCQGGNNAGHTIVVEGKRFAFHLLPSGLIHPNVICVIGNGVVIHVPSFFDEVKSLTDTGISVEGRIKISNRAHIVFDYHQIVDGLREAERAGDGKAIGTTKRGIGPCYSSKANRTGLRVCDLFDWPHFESQFRTSVESKWRRFGKFEYDIDKELARYKELSVRIAPYVCDSIVYLNTAVKSGKRILIEGANAAMLDLDFGTYPYVTSSNCTAGGASTGLGIPPSRIGDVIGVVKAYTTRVGEGPFPTECLNAQGEHLQTVGAERGTTTGRSRRCGWLDLAVLRYSCMLNGYTALNLTKLDVLTNIGPIQVGVRYLRNGEVLESFPASLHELGECTVEYETMEGWTEDISQVRNYADLPQAARNYIEYIEKQLETPIKYIGVGAGREATLFR